MGVPAAPQIPVPEPGKYRVALDSDAWDYGGKGRVGWDVDHFTAVGRRFRCRCRTPELLCAMAGWLPPSYQQAAAGAGCGGPARPGSLSARCWEFPDCGVLCCSKGLCLDQHSSVGKRVCLCVAVFLLPPAFAPPPGWQPAATARTVTSAQGPSAGS